MKRKTLRDFASEEWGEKKDSLAFIEIEGHQFWLHFVLGSLLFRSVNKSADYTGGCFNFLIEPDTSATDGDLRACFLQNWREKTVGRLLLLSESNNEKNKWLVGFELEKLWIANEEGGYPTWCSHSNSLPIEKKHLWTLSSTKLTELILPDWENENLDLRRALEWHRLPESEKWWARLDWEMGSREELENLTRWMAHTDASLWRERDLWGINYMFQPDGSAVIYNLRARSICREPSQREQRLGSLFLQYNRARIQRPPQISSITPAEFYSAQQEAFIAIRFTTPSMHEILEARLKLATWLKNKIPDDEIDSLLTSA